METPREAPKNWLLQFAAGLRFPWLFALTLAIFIADLIIPDIIPFVDEILVGLLALILATFKKRLLLSTQPTGTIEGQVVKPTERAP